MNKRHIFSMYTNIVTIKRTMCLFIHIISMYTHIVKFVAMKRTVSLHSHIFYVYPYLKICNYKKELCE